jgi:hypothetical protein
MRLSRAVRLTMAMFARVRQAREALAAGTAGPERPPAGSSQRAIDAMVRALEARTLDFDAEADDLDDEEDLLDDLYDGPDPAEAPDRPDRESLTELADFGFSLDHCRPGEVIARIYRDLSLPPDPARWPQAWPAEAGGPARETAPDPRPGTPDARPPEAEPDQAPPARPGGALPGDPPLPRQDPPPGGPWPPARRRGPPDDSG